MFVQVVQGTVNDPDALMAAVQRWRDEVGPGATGWLGSTGGVTEDGRFIALVRFASEDDARRNSDRPEQAQWWASTSVHFGDVEFHDCTEVFPILGGGSDDAGFVQVIQGRVEDSSHIKAMLADTSSLHEMRPDILGATLAIEDDGTFTETVAFSDEESARKGEQVQPPPDVARELATLIHGATFYDLHKPWFESP